MSGAELVPLVKLVADGIRVLRTRDGKPITDEECHERAVNIVDGLRGQYLIVARPDFPPLDVEVRHIRGCQCWECVGMGKPIGHTDACECEPCETYKRSVRS